MMNHRRAGYKSKHGQIAHCISSLLRKDEAFTPLECVTNETITNQEMVNKPWLVQILTAVSENGFIINSEQREILTDVKRNTKKEFSDEMKVDQFEQVIDKLELSKRLKDEVAAKRIQSLPKIKTIDDTHVTRCRHNLEELSSVVAKSDNVKIVKDENDPGLVVSKVTQIAGNKILFSTLNVDDLLHQLATDLIDISDFQKCQFLCRNLCIFLTKVSKNLEEVEKRLKKVNFHFSSQRGGWRRDVLELMNDIQAQGRCKRLERVKKNHDVDLMSLQCQLSLPSTASKVLNGQELDHLHSQLQQQLMKHR